MRFYAENSEYPRVIDKNTRYAVYQAVAYGYDDAKKVAKAMNRVWDEDERTRTVWVLREEDINVEGNPTGRIFIRGVFVTQKDAETDAKSRGIRLGDYTVTEWKVVSLPPDVQRLYDVIKERAFEDDGIAPAASVLCGYDPYPQPT